jgi:hypothetical protein
MTVCTVRWGNVLNVRPNLDCLSIVMESVLPSATMATTEMKTPYTANPVWKAAIYAKMKSPAIPAPRPTTITTCPNVKDAPKTA